MTSLRRYAAISATSIGPPAHDFRPALGTRWVETLLVLGVFALHGGWPIPDVNEPYYLGKAKHDWDPTWVPHDFFFATPAERAQQPPEHEAAADTAPPAATRWESHQIFYLLFGWPSRSLSLYQFAWLGRLLSWSVMAWGWRRLSQTVVPCLGAAPITAALFVAGNEWCQMAGEWVVGGFEAKGLAYGLVFFALDAMLRHRWATALAWCGAATSLHVLVGGWSALAIGFAWLTSADRRGHWLHMTCGGLLALVIAIPGLWGALALDAGADPAVVAQGHQIYFLRRIAHHLLPMSFQPLATLRFTLLYLFFLLLCSGTLAAAVPGALRRFVLGALAIAAAGVLLAWGTWHRVDLAAEVLRFYWFRLADVALPLGVALAWPARVLYSARVQQAPYWPRLVLPALVGVLYLATHGQQVLTATRPRADAANKVLNPVDWRAACEWARQQTPADARFLTPRTGQTFKWYAGRSEVVTWKDIPQDAQGIVWWWNRLVDIYGRDPEADDAWLHGSTNELTSERLRALGARYGAGYLLTEAEPRLALELLYSNNSYAIYRLPSAEPAPAR